MAKVDIDIAKEEIIDFIDHLNITENNYDIILYLVKNADNAFFTKVMEEIKDGNLTFNDFIRMFSTDESLDETLSAQSKIYREQKLLRERYLEAEQLLEIEKNKNIHNVVNKYGNKRFKELTTMYKNKTGNTVNYTASDIEKENILLSMLSQDSLDIMEQQYKNAALNKLLGVDMTDSERVEFVDSMLLSINDFIVPVDFNHIVLTKNDLMFAKENGMTEDDMKKMKSFAAFLSTYYE